MYEERFALVLAIQAERRAEAAAERLADEARRAGRRASRQPVASTRATRPPIQLEPTGADDPCRRPARQAA